jgi:hypothetical protein
VIAAMTPSTASVAGAAEKIGNSRATTYTPAATMVAAWIKAEIGVGPAIASGSQVCSGNCALLPATPASRSRPATVSVVGPGRSASTAEISNVPAETPSSAIPSRKPTSPTLVTRNAFTAAAGASGSVRSCAISRYEQMPMTSQPTSSMMRSPATTTSSIAAVNRLTCAAYGG